MSYRVQIDCFKQGSVDGTNLSARVLTIDTLTGTLTISRHDHPETIFYHSLKPSTVQQWPYLNRDDVKGDLTSTKAQRTLCLLGRTAPVPDFPAGEVAVLGIPLPASMRRTLHHPPSPSQQLEAVAVPAAAHPARAVAAAMASAGRGAHEGRRDVWVIRFPTKAAHDVAVQMLRGMSGVRFSGDPKVRHYAHPTAPQPVMGVVV